jgi:predicted dehydrogenase
MVKVGIVGRRGLAYVAGIRSVSGVGVVAFADTNSDNRGLAADYHIESFHPSLEQMLEVCDAVVVGTPMHLHATQSIEALDLGKHVLSEVTAAISEEECKQLLLTARRSAGKYFFAENYCYFEQNLVALELVRQGRFGKLYYGEGDYVHEVRFLHRDASGAPTWRMEWQVGRRGNTYCTHELGPLMQMFRAHDPSIRVKSVCCFGTGNQTDPELQHDDTTLTLIQLSNGGLIKLRLDMVSNRPHRIAYELQGVLGVYESRDQHRFWFGENRSISWAEPEQREWGDMSEFGGALPAKLSEELVQAKQHGHGGGDYFVGRRFAQAISGVCEVEIGIEDAVEWTMVGLLSQQSIERSSESVAMPSWVYEGQG